MGTFNVFTLYYTLLIQFCKLTVLYSKDDICEVKASLLLCERVVCGHLHHRADRHERWHEYVNMCIIPNGPIKIP